MDSCWHPVPSCRPTFEDIENTLTDLLLAVKNNDVELLIHPEAETLPKRDRDRCDTLFKSLLKRQHDVKAVALEKISPSPNHTQSRLRSQGQGDKTLDLDLFKQMVADNGVRLGSFRKSISNPQQEEQPHAHPMPNVVSNVTSHSMPNATSNPVLEESTSPFELLTREGMEHLCDDLKSQTINNRIDKWHLISALATLREISMSTYSVVLAACEIDNSTAASEMDYSKAPLERMASWTGPGGMDEGMMNRGMGA
tara:strand:+ start:188 stop:949 length:762 start_codon:yes stop_codon:yes gene_type:complete